jgi:hypothetical protein
MSISKQQLAQKIKRRLGFPMIKVEIDNTQLFDAIDYARDKFIKWAVGQATQETFFTIALSGGQTIYDLPLGVTEIISYDDSGSAYGGINTLFTVENFLFNQGMYQSLFSTAGNGYTLVSYHIARDFLDNIKRYSPSVYTYTYHKYQNQLEVHPKPPTGNSLTFWKDDIEWTIDSPGWILLRSFMIEGSTNVENWTNGGSNNDFYVSDWIYDYATAEAKEILGRIRSKFANFGSIGNTGISMDGSELISEAKEDKRELEERLKLEETYEGYGISIGW